MKLGGGRDLRLELIFECWTKQRRARKPSISDALQAADASHTFWITLAVVFVETPARLVSFG